MKNAVLLSFAAALLLVGGCLTDDVLIERVGSGQRAQYGEIEHSAKISDATANLLANMMLADTFKNDPREVLRRLEARYNRDPQPQLLLALADLSRDYARHADGKDDPITGHLSCMIYAYTLLTAVDDPAKEPYSPDRLRAMRLYNQSQAELFSYLKSKQLLSHSAFQLQTLSGTPVTFLPPVLELPGTPADYSDVQLCADYRPRNLTHVSYRFGLGAPLIFQVSNAAAFSKEKLNPGQTLPATLVTQFTGSRHKGYAARPVYRYTLDEETLNCGENKRKMPLELDFSTPLAFTTLKPLQFNFLKYAFDPEATAAMQGLYMLQPYDPKRIPVLLVHGLMSNQRTWVQMVNTLQNDPILRKYYQFWGYSYSSGNPVLLSASALRSALDSFIESERKAGRPVKNLERMVVVGHSMGGLLTRTLLLQSDKARLGQLAKLNWEQLESKLTPEQQQLLDDMLIFSPRPYVARVVFIAVPHRGSRLATSWFGKLGSRLIRLPGKLVSDSQTLFRYVHSLGGQLPADTVDINNGIDNLAPDNPTLMMLNSLPMNPAVPYHSIIGNEKRADVPGGSDGIVNYSSSHLDGAKSELVVHSGHSVQQQPMAIMEMRRILLEHLRGYPDIALPTTRSVEELR